MTMTMDNQTTIRRHKGIGIASFIIGVTCIILIPALIGTAGVMATTGKMTPEITMLVGMGALSICFADLIGIALGFVGAVDRSSKKVYPVLGLVLNVVILALFTALIAVGMSMQHA
jgi:hypothetical protein